ncbi:AAA family ATPase [Escherichia coli]|uniref:AAA family ATPase n=1 Tax=Escherichia coli TaxID=562 RepID=UPI00054259B0|nr:AAA family ATPase [Escherichia coli]KHH46100.1 hypothetical protein PU59_02130 [Escherichia coli]
MKLKLKNVTSYHKEYFTELDLSKKINILYGQNGCGKSTISNYFYNPKDTAYKECVCEPIDNYRTLVYNSKYIEDNFYNAKEQKGIFTLSQKNAEIEKILSEKEELNKSLAHQHKEKKEFIEKLHEAKNKKEQECINSIWNKTKDIRSSELKQLMKGQIGSKATFYYHLKKYTPQTDIDIKSLIQSYSKLLEFKGKEIPLITPYKGYVLSEETQKTLSTPIIDSSNSYLSEAIKELQNIDWIKQGKELYLNGEICPFCQRDTIDDNFIKAIESIFDETYSRKVDQIQQIKLSYDNAIKNHHEEIKSNILSCEVINQDEKDKSLSYVKALETIAEKNIKLLDNKIENPSISIVLEFEKSIEEKLLEDIEQYNNKINEFNDKVKRFNNSEIDIREKMWAAIRDLCSAEFEILSDCERNFQEKYENAASFMQEIKRKEEINTNEINEPRNKTSSVDATIDAINSRLKFLGISGFSIDKHAELKDKYIISRDGNNRKQDVYRSLSEGEKTLITFLYFLECCKGKTNENDTDMRDKLIVIDDPISSLSQNYVFDIASMIHHDIIEKGISSKIIILTHNLYFFHELIKLASKKGINFKRDYFLGRINKNEFSTISAIDKKSVQNEYQSLWQVLKDAKEKKINKIIIPNIMRNILEYYFAFVHRTDALEAKLTELTNDENNSHFRAFYRYINRGSHSDAINITDMGDIEPEKYLELLHKIFRMTGDEKHYLTMMGEEEVNVTA